MPAHGVLAQVGEDGAQGRDGGVVGGLAQAIGQLVLEERGGRGEARRDGLDGGDSGVPGLVPRQVLKREQGPEPDRQRRRLGAERLAEAGDRRHRVLIRCHGVPSK